MKRQFILFSFLLFVASAPGLTQSSSSSEPSVKATPKSMWEFGLHAGNMLVSGDIDPKTSLGYGFHLRKATDYIFSLRLDVLAGKAKGEDVGRDFKTSWLSAMGYGVVNFNSLRFDKPVRNFAWFGMLGFGVNQFEASYRNDFVTPRIGVTAKELTPSMGIGFGMSVRAGKRMNIGLEHQGILAFGKRSDLLDGIENVDQTQKTLLRDILNYTSLRLNFNIGNASQRSEPLYWINPLEVVLKDLDEVKKRGEVSLKDSDDDGVIDALDKEPNTPSGVAVDTKGRTLDSDRDGVADHKDVEPFNPPRSGETVNAEGIVTNRSSTAYNPSTGGRTGVTEERVKELIDEALDKYQLTDQRVAMAEWFMPMIHFGVDIPYINYSDYGTLAGIARMMNANPKLRLVVTGFTDQTGTEAHNEGLSYWRAQSVIDHLVNNHGVSRSRFVLQYKGTNDALVPLSNSFINRRVEFRAATEKDEEMNPPANLGTNKGY